MDQQTKYENSITVNDDECVKINRFNVAKSVSRLEYALFQLSYIKIKNETLFCKNFVYSFITKIRYNKQSFRVNYRDYMILLRFDCRS